MKNGKIVGAVAVGALLALILIPKSRRFISDALCSLTDSIKGFADNAEDIAEKAHDIARPLKSASRQLA